MSKKINNIVIGKDIIYFNTIEDKKRKKKCINLKEKGIDTDNKKIITIQILKYAIENNYEFSNSNTITKPYFLTINNIKQKIVKNPYIMSDYDIWYYEFKNSKAELEQQFYNIKNYLYKSANIKLDRDGKVQELEEMYNQVQFKEIKNVFKEPLIINIEDYKKAIQEIKKEMCNCRYLFSKEGKRYIIIKNEKEIIKSIDPSEYLKLVAERNESFSKCTGIENIYFINNNFCIDDTYSECLHYEIRRELMEHLQQTEVIDKIENFQNNEEEEL